MRRGVRSKPGGALSLRLLAMTEAHQRFSAVTGRFFRSHSPGDALSSNRGAESLSKVPQPSSATDQRNRLSQIDFLRGLAALSVCWYHFTTANSFAGEGALRNSGTYGWLGVEIFFVISGFIIPYSLYRAGYRLGDYPTFILKRVTRLDPPYLASIVLVLLLSYLTAMRTHRAFHIDVSGLLLHIAYLNTFFGHPWLNDVFWTLSIEFQYYLLVGLLFPLFSSSARLVRLFSFAFFGLLSFTIQRTFELPEQTWIFPYVLLFFQGLATFQYVVGIIKRPEYILLVVVFSSACLVSLGAPYAIAGLLSVGVINLLKVRSPIFSFLGAISYSVYLLHMPIGDRALFLIGRRFLVDQKLLATVLAVGVTICSAYLFYRFIERPAQRWSSVFRYRAQAHQAEPKKQSETAAPSPGISPP